MSNWKSVPLGTQLTFKRGFDITRVEQQPGDIPVISSSGVSSFHSMAAAKGPGVVIGRKGTLGKTFYAEGDYWPHDTTLWVEDFKGNQPRFAYYFMSNFDTTWLDVGSANPTLNRNHLHEVVVSWPPREAQERIVEVLGALDDKITANGQCTRTLNSLLSSVFASVALPASRPGRLSDIASVNLRTRKPRHGDTIRYLDISSVGNGTYELPALMDGGSAPGRARRVVIDGDTVWSTVRPGRRSHALVIGEGADLIASTGLAVITPETASAAYVYEATRTPGFASYLESVAEGSAYPAVRAERFKDAPVPIAQPEVAAKFDSVATPVRAWSAALARETRTLAELRDTLLPELMSGRIRVKDAEKTVGDVV